VSRLIAFVVLLASACGNAATTLPAVATPDVIRIERNHPKQLLGELKDQEKVRAVVSFINARTSGWSVPWYGPPVGQVYLNLVKDEKVIGNFYVGPWFFGRDHGNFWSQRATEKEVADLEALVNVPLLEIIKSAERR
jgi:hypothetical protein